MKACFEQEAFPWLEILGLLVLPGTVHLKALVQEAPVGFLFCETHSRKEAWIASIGVLKAFRGRGIGSALLLACEEKVTSQSIRLCVRRSNLSAIQLYEHHGYRQIDLSAGYYEDGEDAIIMEKSVDIRLKKLYDKSTGEIKPLCD